MSYGVRIPGSAGIALPGAPKIEMSEFYQFLARLPALRHVIDPAHLSAHGSGYDIKSRAIVTPSSPANNTRIAADPGFNNLPVIELSSLSRSGLHLPPGTARKTYTSICVASGPARGVAGSKNLMTMWSDELNGYGSSYYMAPSGGTTAKGNNADTVNNNITVNDATAPTNTPLPGEAALWMVSFDAETFKSTVLWKKDQFNEVTHTLATNTDANQYGWSYGGLKTSTTNGWLGKLGLALFFDEDLYKPAYRTMLLEVLAGMRERYALIMS